MFKLEILKIFYMYLLFNNKCYLVKFYLNKSNSDSILYTEIELLIRNSCIILLFYNIILLI